MADHFITDESSTESPSGSPSGLLAEDAGARPQPKRIAMVIHALHGGGAERLMSQLANRWSAAGHHVHLVTLASVSTDKYQVESSVQRHGLDLMRPSGGFVDAVRANWQRVRVLRKLLAGLAPDCILSFCDRMNITTVTAALPLGKPLWIAEHSDPSRQHLGLLWETWRQWAYRRLARAPHTGCVVLTPEIATTLAKRFPGLPLVVIPPAIHLNDCISTIIQSPARPSAADAQFQYQLLSMGRHSPEKNLVSLLEAWRKIATEFPRWRLVLAGDGPQHAELVGLASQLQIADSVQFPGWVSDPWPVYRQSDLLAITSLYEGFPVAMLEAMSTGLACVSTPCASIVTEFAGQNGLQLAASSSANDIAAALSGVMKDAQLRGELAKNARVLASKFTWETVGQRWDELLRKLC